MFFHIPLPIPYIAPTKTTANIPSDNRSRYTPFNNVKVVILGQDPYHNYNQAHGLAFSVKPPTPAPPSLKNMYIALKNDYPLFREPPNRGGLLTPWAQRGVLMLNTCLTVRAHEPNSHSNRGWERFTQRVIDLVAQRRTRGVVFMAWGTPASKRVMKIDTKRHLVLKAVHPSPLSAARGFFTCHHFKLANDWLEERYGKEKGPIDWALIEGDSVFEDKQPPLGSPAAKKREEEEQQQRTPKKGSLTEKVEEVVKASVLGRNVKETIASVMEEKKREVEEKEKGEENVAPKAEA